VQDPVGRRAEHEPCRDETDYRMGLLVPESGLFKEDHRIQERANESGTDIKQVNPVCQVKISKKINTNKSEKKILDKEEPGYSHS
jgi:hypothetical protein